MAIYVSADQARGLLPVEASLAVIEDAFRLYGQERKVLSNPSAAFTIVQNDVPTFFWSKGAQLKPLGVVGSFFGAQFGDYYFSLHDCKTGTLLGMVEQAWLTKRRTAATAVVAAKYLANRDARTAALIGAGQIGEEVVRCLPKAFELQDFRVASRTLEGAQELVDRLAPETPGLRAVATAEEAVRGADIVVTITLAQAPVVHPGWLKKGAFLCSMGGVPEVDFGVLPELDRIVVDDLDYALLRGDLATWIDRGHISREDLLARVDADIGEVVLGTKPSRKRPDETIMAVIQGMAVCDLATAKFLVDRAGATGVGQRFDVAPQMTVPSAEKLGSRADSIAAGLQRRRAGGPAAR